MSELPTDLVAFRQYEHDGWQASVASYDTYLGNLTNQTIEPLLAMAITVPGARVLDLACGPGYVAAAAAARGAKVVGADFSPAMVAEARARYPEIEFGEADAEELPFFGGSFDLVVCNFGLMHFPRPDVALREANRVLRGGGRFAFAVWAKPEESPGFGYLLRAVQQYGRMDVPLPPGPPFFRFGDQGETRAALLDAGFTKPRTTLLPLVWRFSSADEFFEAFAQGTVRMAGLLRAQTPEALAAIHAAMTEALAPHYSGDRVEVPMGAILATAVKPDRSPDSPA